MKSFKAQKAHLVFIVILSVFISSSLVYGDSGIPGEAVSPAVIEDGYGMTNQGIISLVHGMSGTATASTPVTGFHDTAADVTEMPSTIRTANWKSGTDKAHFGSRECQESCSLN